MGRELGSFGLTEWSLTPWAEEIAKDEKTSTSEIFDRSKKL